VVVYLSITHTHLLIPALDCCASQLVLLSTTQHYAHKSFVVFILPLFLPFLPVSCFIASLLQVRLPVAAGATRERLSLGCYNRSPTEAELVVFGGKNPELPSMVIISDDTTLLYLGMCIHIQEHKPVFGIEHPT